MLNQRGKTVRDKVIAGLVAALLSALLAACAWYLKEVTTELREMRAELRQVDRDNAAELRRISADLRFALAMIERNAGGDPLAPEGP